MKSARGKIVKAAGLLMVLQVLEHVIGLLKQMVIAAAFGTSAAMDGYLVAMTIVGLILLWVGLPVRQTLLPMFRYDLTQRGEAVAWANVSVLFNNLLVALTLIVVIGEIVAPQLVAALAPGFQAGTDALSTSLARIMLVSAVFLGMGNVLSEIFFSYERFFWPGIAGSVNNLVVMLVLLAVGGTYGIHGLAVAVVLGAACEFVLYLPILWEKRAFYSGTVNLRHPSMVEMGKMSFPLLISTGGNELARITDRIFASLLSAGSLSALAFAHRPITILLEFLIRPLNKATFPRFTTLCAQGDFRTFSRQLFYYARMVFFITLPLTFGIMVTAEVGVRALYQRGAFDETAVHLTSQALFFYAIGMPAHAMMRVFRSTFFNLKDTWTPMKIALLCVGIKIVLSWILVQSLAHRGIALAESISEIANALLLFYFLPREVKGQEGWKTAASFAQTLAGCLAMWTVVYLVSARVDGVFSPSLQLASLVFVGAAIYGTFALFFQGEASEPVLKMLTEVRAKYLPRSS